VSEALRSMDRHHVNQLVVMDGNFVVGIVTREDIVRALIQFRSSADRIDPTDSGTSI
jgi:CBS domain-containing protein